VVPSGTSAAQESSIFVGEGRGLDHSNCMDCTVILVPGGSSVVKASGLVALTLWTWPGGRCEPLGTSAALESSIFVGEGRGLDHSNRLLKARISIIADILKALKMEFCDFLSCIWTPESGKKWTKKGKKNTI
jgi:hypothetical protein